MLLLNTTYINHKTVHILSYAHLAEFLNFIKDIDTRKLSEQPVGAF